MRRVNDDEKRKGKEVIDLTKGKVKEVNDP
jgi:hypothetical protein